MLRTRGHSKTSLCSRFDIDNLTTGKILLNLDLRIYSLLTGAVPPKGLPRLDFESYIYSTQWMNVISHDLKLHSPSHQAGPPTAVAVAISTERTRTLSRPLFPSPNACGRLLAQLFLLKSLTDSSSSCPRNCLLCSRRQVRREPSQDDMVPSLLLPRVHSPLLYIIHSRTKGK